MRVWPDLRYFIELRKLRKKLNNKFLTYEQTICQKNRITILFSLVATLKLTWWGGSRQGIDTGRSGGFHSIKAFDSGMFEADRKQLGIPKR